MPEAVTEGGTAAPETSDTAEPTNSGDAELRGLLNMRGRLPPAAIAPGQLIDETYRVERTLGAGGMGVVYLARDVRLRRDVAIKIHTSVSELGNERLMREASALAQLVHPNVVTVYEAGTWNHHPYVAMEYVRGGTARTWLAATPRRPREILAVYLAAGRGLAAAHAAGLIHRDFKPDNVLIGDDGRVRVADFGLARAFDTADGLDDERHEPDDALPALTITGAVMGTPAYMAPEQRGTGAVGPAADQFAFAVTLWEALAGTRPAAGDKAPPGGMPPHVVRALTQALAVDPAARFSSIDGLLAALARDPAARRRRRALAAAAVLGIGALVSGSAWLASRTNHGTAPTSCADAKDGLAGVWDDAHRRGLPARVPAQVIEHLDAYADEWTAARIETCEATKVRHEQTLPELALRDRCLEGRRDQLRAVVDVLADAAANPSAIQALDPIGDCADVVRLGGAAPLPDDPAARAEIAAVDAQVAQVRALYNGGRLDLALTQAQAAVARARVIDHDPLSARALLWLARVQIAKGDLPTGHASIEEAAQHAAAAHDDPQASAIWLQLLQYLVFSGDLSAADNMLPVVQAAIVRAGSRPDDELTLEVLLGQLKLAEGHPADGQTHLERAVALYEQRRGKDDPLLATPLHYLSGAHVRLGDLAGARAIEERAIALVEHAYGESDAHIADLLDWAAQIDAMSHDYAKALPELQRVVALKETLFGKDSPVLALTLGNVAQALIFLGRASEALAPATRALAIIEQRYGPDHRNTAQYLVTRAKVLASTDDLAGARTDLDRAVEILGKSKDDEAALAAALIQRGHVRWVAEDDAGSHADIERARAYVKAHPDDAALARSLAATEAQLVP